ncbi:PDDEXK family nuclease [Carboxydichorda subterranea]|uniref:hypothetical protein n=1 Tax=Carboxydichorda subterranea TaxID=3109565 RepID=UPI0038571FFE
MDEGQLVIMAPAGWRHNRTVSRTARLLGNFAKVRRLGEEPVLPGLACRLMEEHLKGLIGLHRVATKWPRGGRYRPTR